MMRNISVRQRGTRDHLGVQTRATRDEAQEKPATPVGPVHHRCDAQPMCRVTHERDALYRPWGPVGHLSILYSGRNCLRGSVALTRTILWRAARKFRDVVPVRPLS